MKRFLVLFCVLFTGGRSGSQQLVNAGFEQWDTAGHVFRPVGWSANIAAALYHNPAGIAREGKRSIVVSTWYSYVPGHLFYGNFTDPEHNNWLNLTVPFTGRPARLTGYYRYTHPVHASDKAMGEIMLRNAAGDTMASGRVLLDTASSWRRFAIRLDYRSPGKTAAIAIHFSSWERNGGMNDDSYPNRLYLDELKLEYK